MLFHHMVEASASSEWTGRLTVKVVLDMANGSCAEVDKFKFENLKRSSGHNTLLERQVDHEWAAKQAQTEDVTEPPQSETFKASSNAAISASRSSSARP